MNKIRLVGLLTSSIRHQDIGRKLFWPLFWLLYAVRFSGDTNSSFSSKHGDRNSDGLEAQLPAQGPVSICTSFWTEWETASTVRFVPLPSTSSNTYHLTVSTYGVSDQLMATDELTEIIVFSILMPLQCVLAIQDSMVKLQTLNGSSSWFRLRLSPCVSSRPFMCGMRQPSMLGRSRAHGHNIYMQNVGGVGRFRSDKQHSRKKVVVARITY